MAHGDALTVLLVEDDPTDAALFKALLGHSSSFSQLHAESMAAALDILRHQPVDLVVLDLGLPDSPVDATYTRIRDQVPDVAVIVLTGHDDDETAYQALADGAQDFLVKNDVTEALLAKSIRYSVERHRAGMGQRHQRSQELEVYASLVPDSAAGAATSPVAERAPGELDAAAATYGSLLDQVITAGHAVHDAEIAVQLEALAGRLADLGATPPDLAAIHAAALTPRQRELDAATFARYEDAARLLLLRFTGELANRYRARAVEAQAEAGDDDGDADPAALPADARERLVDVLADQLEERSLLDITLADLATTAGLAPGAVRAAVGRVREPLLVLVRQELERQRDLAGLLLTASPGEGIDAAAHRVVGALVELWRAGRTVTLATIAASGDDTVADLRLGHLRSLAALVVDGFSPVVDTASVEGRRTAELAVGELFAVLDQKLVLGELFPVDQDRDAAVGELAGRLLTRLDPGSPPPSPPPPPAPTAPPSAAPEPTEVDESDSEQARRLTGQDYAAWAERMRNRRRSEIDALYTEEAPPPAPDPRWSPESLFQGGDDTGGDDTGDDGDDRGTG